MGHAIGLQAVQFRGIELQRVIAKDISDSGIELRLLPIEQIAAQRRRQPLTPSLRHLDGRTWG